MKSIPESTESAQWNNKLLKDLAFIKRYKRYPLNKKTIIPSFSLLLILFFGLRMIYITLFIHPKYISVMLWIAMVLIAISILGMIYSFYKILRFTSIATPFFTNENMRLVNEFLRSQQLNVYRHPQAPEVFQILSRPLGGNTEQREVMIFIADDAHILINSHFINQKWVITPQSRNYRKMANRLKEWLKIHYPNTNTAVMA